MTLQGFVALVDGFDNLSHPDKILHFGWYVHTHEKQERFTTAAIRSCYARLSLSEPNFSEQLKRLVARRPKVLLDGGGGYRLEHGVRQSLDQKYGDHETTIALSQMLRDLPGNVSDDAERLFLSEAIKCYGTRAFRAAIVMVWNLAYDHILNWILADAGRLKAFQSHIAGRVGQRKAVAVTIAKREDFEELKEAEVLDICGKANLFPSSNTKKILEIQLTKRNMAAHPSLVSIEGPQADDAISSLVNNVVLVLK